MLRPIGTVSAVSVAEVERQAIALDLGAPVSIRVNPRARRLLLRIDAASRQVELVLPRGVPAEHGLKFLAAQKTRPRRRSRSSAARSASVAIRPISLAG